MNEGSEKEIRILIADSNESDISKVVTLLRDAQMSIALETAQSEEGLADTLRAFKPDVVLSEYALPLLDYRTTLKVVQSIRPGTPVIILSGPMREEDTGSCVRAGAESFISKLNMVILPAAIIGAVAAREPLLRLTSRQSQGMRLGASGYRTHEVARELKLSAKTGDSHRHQGRRKLGL